jgi:hypothetical protein
MIIVQQWIGLPEAGAAMAWNDKVLDNLEQVYRSPGMINLGTVQQLPTEDGTGFFVSRERLSGGRAFMPGWPISLPGGRRSRGRRSC